MRRRPRLTSRPSQSESVLIQKLYTHFKKTPPTHKLGVLYVVDSVTRKWMDMAKAEGQPVGPAARDGTPAAGVHRVTELMPTLMNDIIATAPEDHKVRIKQKSALGLSATAGYKWNALQVARKVIAMAPAHDFGVS